MHDDGNTRLMLPWLAHDVEEMETLCGGDPGGTASRRNRRVLETLAGYVHREGFVQAPIDVDRLFVPIVSVSE